MHHTLQVSLLQDKLFFNMPASTHIKFFEYKPSGKDRKLQKTQTGCHSTFPIHLIRDVNQATTQNRSSPLNTSQSNTSSSSTASNKSSSNVSKQPVPPQKPSPPSVQSTPQLYTTSPIYISQPAKTLPQACVATTTTLPPTQYYAQTLPSLPLTYLKTIVHPTTLALPPCDSPQYLVQYHPHHTYHTYSSTSESNSLPPMRFTHGISKPHKMTHPVRQIRLSRPLCEKIHDVPQNQVKMRYDRHIWQGSSSNPVPSISKAPASIVNHHLKTSTTASHLMGKSKYDPITLSSSSPTVEYSSPSKTANHNFSYPSSTPTNHLNVGSQSLPSISDLFGKTQSKSFRSAISLTDILN